MRKYFEFPKHEYYGLVTTEFDAEHAILIYHQFIAGNSVEEVRLEGVPLKITEEEALEKFLRHYTVYDIVVELEQLMKEFDTYKNEPLLIDGSLI